MLDKLRQLHILFLPFHLQKSKVLLLPHLLLRELFLVILIKVLLPDIEKNSAPTKEEDRLLYEKLIQERSELKKTSEFIDSAISESKVTENQYKLNKALSKVSEKYSDEEISAALSSDYCKSHPKLIKKFSEKLSERKQANEQVMVLEDECTRGR